MKKIHFVFLRHFIIFIFVLFCIPSAPLYAKETSNAARTIKVGASDFSIFFTQDKEGNYTGIVCDYLLEISKYTGWKIEYVIDSPSVLLDKLASGEIDLMGSMNKTDQLLDLYDYAELPSGFAYSALVAKSDNLSYIPGDYDSFTKDMLVGIYDKSTARTAAFEQFCLSNDITVIPVYYDDFAAWENCLNTGEVDAILTNSAKLKEDEKILVNFKKEAYYFASTKGKSDIIRELNIALEKIYLINPQFDSAVYQKYVDHNDKNVIPLTSREMEFVSANPVLRVVTAPNWKPISYFNDSANNYSGITIDVLNELSETTGFQFEILQADNFKECLDMLASGEADLLAGIYNTDFLSSNYDVTLSIPYLPTQTLILHRKDVELETLNAVGNLTLAMPYGFDYNHNFENCSTVYYDTVNDCINAVKKGKVDFTAISSLAVEHYIRNKGKGDLVLVPVPNSIMELSLAFANPADPRLLSIIDKAVYSITEAKKQSIIFKNTSFGNEQLTFLSLVYSNPTQVISILAVISLLLILLLFFIMRMRLRLSQNIALNAEAYNIIEELSNEYLFEYNFADGTMKLPSKFAKLTNVPMVITHTNKSEEGIGSLFTSFAENKSKTDFTIEFKCSLNKNRQDRFRAVCVILKDAAGKPVRGIGKIINVQADFEEKEKLQIRAVTDSLTGLHNKMYCEELVLELFENTADLKNAAMLLIDLDHFKEVNDTLGHLGGDEALKYFSNVLTGIFKDHAILGRWGGDEFFVFIQNAPNQGYINRKAKELCTAMDTSFHYEGITHKLSISTGIAFTTDNFDYQTMFQTADEALYSVKQTSRNGYANIIC